VDNVKISRTELLMALDECHAVACFLTVAIELVFGENSNFTLKYPAPHGAGCCLGSLVNKLRELKESV